MTSYYPLSFSIPSGDRIVAVMLQKLDCGNNCTYRERPSSSTCWCTTATPDDDICGYCMSDNYRYNEIIITSSSDKFDERPVYTCRIIKNGTTSIIAPKNNQVYTVPNHHRRDCAHSFTIVIESFDFGITSDDSDMDVFEPHIDLLISMTGCYSSIQRANLQIKSMSLMERMRGRKSKANAGAGASAGASVGSDIGISITTAQSFIEQMILENMTQTMRCDKSINKIIQPISRTFANAIVRSRIQSKLQKTTKGDCPHIGKIGKIGRIGRIGKVVRYK